VTRRLKTLFIATTNPLALTTISSTLIDVASRERKIGKKITADQMTIFRPMAQARVRRECVRHGGVPYAVLFEYRGRDSILLSGTCTVYCNVKLRASFRIYGYYLAASG
jgi:hypothetical protein